MASFNEGLFEEKLLCLKDTQDSIASLSSWCLSNKEYHEKIVSTWLNVLKKVKIEHRLVLFYLANDVIQYSRRKSLPFADSFAPALQKATKLVREDNVRNKIMRLFKIWSERGVYEEEFLVDLSNVLNRIHKNTSIDVQEFQSSAMFSKIRKCKELEEDTDVKLKTLNENHVSFTDIERFRNYLKDREHGDELLFELDAGIGTVKAYIKALETEINERLGLIDLLEIAEEYYEREFQEAKVVVNAYKCFATRVRGVKRKLEDQIETMPSPVPSPDANAPSPSPEHKDVLNCDNNHSADFKPNNYFPPNEIRKGNDDISPYSPDSDFDSEPLNSTYLNETEPEVYEVQSSLVTNGVDNDSSSSKTISTYELSESLSNDKSFRNNKLSEGAFANNNSASNVSQGKTDGDVNASSNVQQLSLSALLQTLIPSEGSINPSVSKIELFQNLKPEKCNEPEDLWESPESPPLYEKANYPTIADEQINQDIDMRFADRDDRNLLEFVDTTDSNWPNDDTDYRTSGRSEKTSVICSQSQDNVENIDMEMSDEEDKVNKTKESDVKQLPTPTSISSGILTVSIPNSKSNNFKLNDISRERSFLNTNQEDNITSPTILPKTGSSLCISNHSVTPTYSSNSTYNSSSYSNDSASFGINVSFNNNNILPIKSCYSDYISPASGKGDAPNLSNFNIDKFSKLQPPLPPLLPPPPPPPPQPPQLWTPAFTTPPPPPQLGSSQSFVQQSLFFPRPPPPVLPTPHMPVMNRPYRANVMSFPRVSSRFQRW